jgi:hypothetical protein
VATIVKCPQCSEVNIGSRLYCVNCQTSLIGILREQGNSPISEYTTTHSSAESYHPQSLSLPSSYIEIEDSEASLQFTIRIQRQWAQILFLCFWLIGWTVGGVLATWWFLTEKNSMCIMLFLAFWLIGWLQSEIYAVDSLFWQLGGKEIIEISKQSITLRRPIMGLWYSKKYQARDIENLCFRPIEYFNKPHWRRHANFWELGDNLLTFDYKGKTTRLIWGLNEFDGKQMLALIRQRFSQYI